MKQCCVVVVEVDPRLECLEEVGDGVGGVLSKDLILRIGKMLIWYSVKEGDQEEIMRWLRSWSLRWLREPGQGLEKIELIVLCTTLKLLVYLSMLRA